MPGREHEHRFELFGSEVRLLIGPPLERGLAPPDLAALRLEAFLRAFHARLTRFDSASELSVMNACSSKRCSVSPLLALAVRAGLWSAERSAGLVDPTLVGELERVGYDRTRAGVEPASLAQALTAAPPRRPAGPSPDRRWQSIEVDHLAGLVRRPPGVRFDTGGTGKGLAADLSSARLAGYASHAIDAGGDIAIGGEDPAPRLVEIEDPISGGRVHSVELVHGAVATSGIGTRLWRTASGFAHHLIDPSTGRPAWTGVVQATAVAATALEAETLAKVALLSGPEAGAAALEQDGGLLVLDDGEVVAVGPLRDTFLSRPTREAEALAA
jgi:thiamine biosynthesis lipoprotein